MLLTTKDMICPLEEKKKSRNYDYKQIRVFF